MNTHPYTLTKLNEQRLESLHHDSRLAIASMGSRINFLSKLQNLYDKFIRHNQNQQQDPCCAQN
ncbi:hypothetical protein [Bacillus sp. LL01]|uniref:hypothetical protein n=1 Tax=Bacillus sp. LL01 TaxID=1665556 RepID=UPI000FFF285E|nr:hypothetical protein [Bacillus sp. LL01]